MMYKHGGDVFEKNIQLDFSININPLGMPSEVATAIKNAVANADIYPDYKSRKLTRLLAKKHGVSEDSIVIGNGASELIFAISRLKMLKKAVVISPTFSEYAESLEKNGVDVFLYQLSENMEFSFEDIEKIPPCDIMFFCNPNNPTGKYTAREIVTALAKKTRDNGGILVCDECFLEFVKNGESVISDIENYPNIIALRAFTKSYAMAGVRLGYLVASEKLACEIKSHLPMWNVSSLAQAGGETAIEKCSDFGGMLEVVENGRRYLENCLLHFGFKVYISDCNFILFECRFDLKTPLLERGILIRDCENFENLSKNYYRICVATQDKNRILIKNIAEILAERGEL